MKLLPIFALLLTGALSAQDATILPYPMPPTRFEDLKTYLSLSDTQVTALQQIMQSKSDAESAIYKSINEKYQTLNTILNSTSPDAFQVGRLTLEIRDLQKKVPLKGEPYRTNALNVLNALQKTKLPALTAALQTATPAYQAVTLNLIDQPQRPGVNPLDLPFLTNNPVAVQLPAQE